MLADEKMTDEQFNRHARSVLEREFGPDGPARFLRLNRSGVGDYTFERDLLHKDLSLDEVFASIQRHRS